MERQTFLKSVATAGTLLTTTGYMGGGSKSQPTADTEAGNEAGSSTTDKTTIETEPARISSPELTLRTNSDILRVVHMGDEKITSGGADEVYITVDDEHTAAWVVDSDKGGEFPVSVGNFLEIESVENGSMVEVVWVDSRGAEEVLATHEISAGETTTTTTTNETTTNKMATNETVTNETIATTATEMTISLGNETSN